MFPTCLIDLLIIKQGVKRFSIWGQRDTFWYWGATDCHDTSEPNFKIQNSSPRLLHLYLKNSRKIRQP